MSMKVGFVLVLSFMVMSASAEAGRCKRIARYAGITALSLAGLGVVSLGGLSAAVQMAADSNQVSLRGPDGAKTLKVAMIGDSLSRDFQCNGSLGCVWQGHTKFSGGPFLDANPSSGPLSFVERLSATHTVDAVSYAAPNAFLLNYQFDYFVEAIKFVGNIKTAPVQMQSLMKENSDTDLILVWVGHNDASMIQSSFPGTWDEAKRTMIRNGLFEGAEKQTLAYLQALDSRGGKKAIVFYRPIKAEILLKVLKFSKDLKASHPELFPYREQVADYFPDPDNRESAEKFEWILKVLFEGVESALEKAKLEIPAVKEGRLRVEISEAFQGPLPLGQDYLSASDGVHPSALGQEVLADRLFEGARPAIEWLSQKDDR